MEFSGLEQRIVDTAEFQRLRGIRQMAFTHLVYPGANHTRFEHSLGACHVAGLIAQKVGLDKDQVARVRLAGLLHDIGHTTFSHDGERLVSRYLGDHEEIGRQIVMKSPIRDILAEHYPVKDILDLEKKPEGKIITSDLGADRIDYLLRDARATGVTYGIIDIERLIHTLKMEGHELCVEEGGLEAAETLLIARFAMFSTVYLHRTVRIAAAMLRKGVQLALEEKTIMPEDFLRYSDEEMLRRLCAGTAKPWAQGILQRHLFKAVHEFTPSNPACPSPAFEKELTRQFGCDVLVDCPFGFSKPIDIRVKTRPGPLRPLIELSDPVKALQQSEEKRKKVLVLCPAEKRDELKERIRREGLPEYP